MDNVWHYLGLYVGLEFLGVCSGYPVPPFEGYTHLASGWATTTSLLLSTAFLVCSVVFVVGCLCCRRTKGFQEFTDATSVQGYVNDGAATNTTEFTIFPPLPPLSSQAAANQAVRFEPLPDIRPMAVAAASRQLHAKKPAAFNNIVSHGLNAHDWFGEGVANFPRHQLQYVRELGRGWFGRAVEGSAQLLEGSAASTPCVVKILHEDASVTDQMYFLHEVRPYRDLDHPNVLKMLGRCLEADPFLVLLEACPTGDLKTFLCQNIATAGALSEQGVTLNMACNIAAGLHHMLENGYVHTDVAARNCLVTPTLSVKIGDYGHSIEAFKEDYYLAGDVALPVRWCAPETLHCTDTTIETKEVTPAANVWSYGVVLWEIGEFGRLPYAELTDDEVVVQVVGEKTRRLGKPSLKSPHGDSLYLLMQQCWGPAASRPALPQVMSMLTHLQRHPSTDGSPRTVEDFEQRWETFKPNTIVVTDNHLNVQPVSESDSIVIPPTSPQPSTASSCDLFKDNKVKSDSLQNLRGSLDDLSSGQWERNARKHSEGSVPASLGADFDSWLKGGAGETDEEDARFVQKISEAIQDLDDALALELTSSSSSSEDEGEETSKQHSPVRQNAVLDFRLGRQEKEKDSGSSDDTEEEMWRGRIERGEFSAKVKAKSKSVADLMVLTHIEPSDNSDSEPPSLTWSFERRTSNNNSFSRPRKTSLVLFGSENDIHNSILGEDFLESLHQIQVARRDINRNPSNTFVEREQSANYLAESQAEKLEGNRNVNFLDKQSASPSREEAICDSNENVTVVDPKKSTNQIKDESFLAIDASEKEPQVGCEIQDGSHIISANGDVSEAVESAENLDRTDVNIFIEKQVCVLKSLEKLPADKANNVKENFDKSNENHNLGNVESYVASEIIVEDQCNRVSEVTQKKANIFIESRLPTMNHVEDKIPKKESNVLSEKAILEPSGCGLETDTKKEVLKIVESAVELQENISNKVPEIMVSEPSPRKNKTPVESPRKPVPLPRRKLNLVSHDSSEDDQDSVPLNVEMQEGCLASVDDHTSSEGDETKTKSIENRSEAILPVEKVQYSTITLNKSWENSLLLEEMVDDVKPVTECGESIEDIRDNSKSSLESIESSLPPEKVVDGWSSNENRLESSSFVVKVPDSTDSLGDDEDRSVDLNFTTSTPYKPHIVPRQLINSNIVNQSENLVHTASSDDKDFTENSGQNCAIPSDNETDSKSTKDNFSELLTVSESVLLSKPSSDILASTESSVVLGPCEDYTMDYFKGLKTAYNENESSEIDYSINGWDSFLGETLETHQYDDVNFVSPSTDSFPFSNQIAVREKSRDNLVDKEMVPSENGLIGKDGCEVTVLNNKEVLKPESNFLNDTYVISQDLKVKDGRVDLKSLVSPTVEDLTKIEDSGENVVVAGCAMKEDDSNESVKVMRGDLEGSVLKLGELVNNTSSVLDSSLGDDLRQRATENVIDKLKNEPELCIVSEDLVADIAIEKNMDNMKPTRLGDDDSSANMYNLGEINNTDILGKKEQNDDLLMENIDKVLVEVPEFSKPPKFVPSDLGQVEELCSETVQPQKIAEDLEETMSITLVSDDLSSREVPVGKLNNTSADLLENLDKNTFIDNSENRDLMEALLFEELRNNSNLLLGNLDATLKCNSEEVSDRDFTEVPHIDELNHSTVLLENTSEILNSKPVVSAGTLVEDALQSEEFSNKALELKQDLCSLLNTPGNFIQKELEYEASTNEINKLILSVDVKNKVLDITNDLYDLNNKTVNIVEKKLSQGELSSEINIFPQVVEIRSEALIGNLMPESVSVTKVEESSTKTHLLPEALDKHVSLLNADSVETEYNLSGFHINVLASGDDLRDLDDDEQEEEECDDEFSLDVKHSTPDDERSSDSGFRDNKGSLSESCEDACDEKYNLEDIEAELEETFNRGGFNHHEENSMVFGEEYSSKCSSNILGEDRSDEYSGKALSNINVEETPVEYNTNSSKDYSVVQNNFDDILELGNVVSLKENTELGVVGEESVGNVSLNADSKAVVQGKTDSMAETVTPAKQSGWYLHPPSETEPEEDPDAKSSSYVSFSLDEEFVTAIRNELIDKLPLANESADKLLQANRNADDVMDMDEDDLEERQDIMIHYNVYQAPLSPILEEPESLGGFDWTDEKSSSFNWSNHEEQMNKRFEEDIREALEGCSIESSSSSDKDPNNRILLEDLDNISKVIKVRSTSTDLEDDLLVVDTVTNEARLLESPKPKPHLAFVNTKAVSNVDAEESLSKSYTPDSISPTTTSSGSSEFLTPSDVSPLHLPPTPATVHHLCSNNEAAEIMSDLVNMYEQDSSSEDCTQSYESSDMSPVERLDLLTANLTKTNDLTTTEADFDRTLKLNDLGQLLKLASLEMSTKDKSPVSPEVNMASKDIMRQFVNASELNLNGLMVNNEAKDLLSPDSPKYEVNVHNAELLQEDLSALNEVAASSMLAFSGPRSSTLEDITFSGPGVDDVGEMSTSFSGHGDEEEDDDDYAPDWESDSEENSSSSGEFIWQAYECLSNYPMESIAEEDEDDDDSSTCSSSSGSGAEFIPSAWNSQAEPVRSALRSPEKTTEWKKNVTFKKQKYHCVYEYPRDSSEDAESESASWRPSVGYANSSPINESPVVNYMSYSTNSSPVVSYANYSTNKTPEVDYASYADWELMDGEEVEADTESESDNVGKTSRPNKFDFYKLGGEDYDFSGGLEDGEFFISSSARPFQPHDAIASQFFPGQSDPSVVEEEIDLSCLEPSSPMSPTGLGELRHTRDRLKLNLLDAPPAGKKGRSLGGEATLLDSDTEDSGIESSNGMTAQLTLKTTLDTDAVDHH